MRVMHVVHVMSHNPFYHIKLIFSVMRVMHDIDVTRAKSSSPFHHIILHKSVMRVMHVRHVIRVI